MSSSYENFQSRFVDEALDNISDLEQALMALELSPESKELIERVFRALHSLKGGGAMFGFARLSEFTHRLENIYEMVRSGQLRFNQLICCATFWMLRVSPAKNSSSVAAKWKKPLIRWCGRRLKR
jgi:two-component system chemotaxis sensor kinase CheA